MADINYDNASGLVVGVAGAIVAGDAVFESPASQNVQFDFANSSVSVSIQSPVIFSYDGTTVAIDPVV